MRLLERYFNYSFQGFDLYYYLFVDRSKRFKVDYLEYGTNTRKTVVAEGVSIEEREKSLMKK
jgi:hypothetical protein